ncbi:unnamed protein product [Cylindrotheca closterium]|uniref:DHHA2 domain-containing protein n=1 Tax=Cylindrotheca closterium TaxID=2856 RepID=A0AAD2G8C7_9STRA|nr:unnamed protein product [Cylindrotheca closterium]
MLPSVSEFLRDSAVSFAATSSSSQSATTISQPISICLGNPAGDADSIISAIAFAYINTVLFLSASCSSEEDSSMTKSTTTIPIVSIPHESLTTQRPETRYILQQLAKIDLNDLIAIDSLHLPTSASVSLVDHNSLTIKNKPDWTVVSILDHHIDEGQHMDSCSAPEQRNVAFDSKTSSALVASTCTLVVERFPVSDKFPPTLAVLLLGVILLDSVNLSPKAGKVTPRDESAVQTLLDRTTWSELRLPEEILANDGKPDPTKLFDILQNQKFHPDFWNSLTLLQALNLDFKSFEIMPPRSFGVASVLQTMTEFMEKHDWMNSMDSTCSKFVMSFDVFAIMFFSFSNRAGEDTGPQRQLALLAKSEESLEEVADSLKQDTSLQLEEVKRSKSNDDMYLICFKQGNPKASRKQVAPILMKYFTS